MACPKYFHFPCVAASGGFQVIQTHNSFCNEHLGQVPLICKFLMKIICTFDHALCLAVLCN